MSFFLLKISNKMCYVPYLILYQWKKCQCHIFSFSRYQTKCVIKFFFRQLMRSQTLWFIFEQPLKQWLTGRKREEDGNTKIWISREQKELFRWNKKHFWKFLKSYHLKKNKNLLKEYCNKTLSIFWKSPYSKN